VSHPEQLGFFECVAALNRALYTGGRVIEIGSYDVNGGVRRIFDGAAEYVGVDLKTGPGVDVVSFGHNVTLPDASFDAAVSGECFEHDPHWRDTFANMIRMTRPGGLVAFTCATTGRPEHGTRRTDVQESPGTQAEGLDYYRNLTEAEFRAGLQLDQLFSSYAFWSLSTSFDLYFAGIRTGDGTPDGPTAQLPGAAAIEQLGSLMSLPHRAVRVPLRALSRVLPPERYQSVAVPYWRALLRAQDRVAGGRFRRAEH